MSIIELLQEATEPVRATPEQQEARRNTDPYWAAVRKAFSRRFVDEMLGAECDAWVMEVSAAYERGFCDAFQLWTEVFSRYSS